MRKAGFTLMELLVGTALIAVLASLLFPVLQQAQEHSRQVACMSNQRQLAIAIEMSAQDHGETYPSQGSWWTQLNVPSPIFLCPTYQALLQDQPRLHEKASGDEIDYAYNGLLAGKETSKVKDTSLELLTVDSGADEVRSNADGAVTSKPNSGSYDSSSKTLVVSPREDHLLVLPSDVSYRHNNAFIASYCDGHAALTTEVPPLWVVNITSTALFTQEVLDSHYPVVVLFGAIPSSSAILLPSMASTAYIPNFGADMIYYVQAKLSRIYRGRVKFVSVNGHQLPSIMHSYRVTGAPGGMPDNQDNSEVDVVLFKLGKEIRRMRTFCYQIGSSADIEQQHAALMQMVQESL